MVFQVPIVSDSVCASALSGVTITSDMLCAGILLLLILLLLITTIIVVINTTTIIFIKLSLKCLLNTGGENGKDACGVSFFLD